MEDLPVYRLTKALPVRQLLEDHESEFEIRPEDDLEEQENGSHAESNFKFEDLQKKVNLGLLSVENEDGTEDASPFDKYRRKMHRLTEDGKILKHVVKEGFGSLVPDNSLVYVRYEGYFEYNEIPFDCTFHQNNCEGDFPVALNLGKGGVIPGLHQAILSMRKGEKSEFLIHPDLAYGKMGCGKRIPPDSTVLFVVEIERFVDCGDIHVTEDLDEEQRSLYCNVRKVAKGYYLLANDHFGKENYSTAANKYRQVINMLHNARAADEEEDLDRNHFLIKIYTNACVCYHKLKNYKKVCIMASDAVQVNRSEAMRRSKLLYYWGYAKMVLGDFSEAKKHLSAASRLNPTEPMISEALRELDKRQVEDRERERVMMQKAFNFQPKAKIQEYDEAEECFRSCIREQLTAFIRNSQQSAMTIRRNYTRDEERMCLEIAKDMGLYARVVDGDVRYIHITKPE